MYLKHKNEGSKISDSWKRPKRLQVKESGLRLSANSIASFAGKNSLKKYIKSAGKTNV